MHAFRKLPQQGDKVTIDGNMNILMDIDPPLLLTLTVNGTLFCKFSPISAFLCMYAATLDEMD
jgi:hypothetical protein